MDQTTSRTQIGKSKGKHMNYTFRDIESDADYQLVADLWNSHSRMMRCEYNVSDLSTKGGHIIGTFVDNELVATLRYHEWVELPVYYMGSLFTKKGLLPLYDFSLKDNPIVTMTDMILERMEAKQFYTWYYVRAMAKGYARIEKNGHDLLSQTRLGGRYDRFVQEVVKAGDRSVHAAHHRMASNNVWDRNVMIVQCNLRNEHRVWGDVFKNEMNLL